MSDCCDLLCLDLPKAEAIRRARPSSEFEQATAEQAAAFGDATRVAIAAALRATDELCVCDLSWIVERPEKAVSHHVRKMRGAGVLASRRDGRMVMYALTPAGRRLADVLLPNEVAAR